MRTSMNLKKEKDTSISWRRITRALRDLYNGKNQNLHKDNEFDLTSDGNKFSGSITPVTKCSSTDNKIKK